MKINDKVESLNGGSMSDEQTRLGRRHLLQLLSGGAGLTALGLSEHGAIKIAHAQSIDDRKWRELVKITPADGKSGDRFGSPVSVSKEGTTALIRAGNNDNPRENNTGSAYVFTQAGDKWRQQQKFTSDNDGDNFGFTLSLSGDGTTAVVGAAEDNLNGDSVGSAYVFTETDGGWTQQQKLTADDGDSSDFFGRSVAVSGDGTTIIIGTADDDPNGPSAGSAYIFIKRNGEWIQQQKLAAADGDERDLFGRSVSVSEDGKTALIGAFFDEDPNGKRAGSAYVFTETDGEWAQQQKLAANDGEGGERRSEQDKFGDPVAISGDGTTALIGAPNTDSVYVFTESNGEWTQQQKFSRNDSTRFGETVTVSDDGTIVFIASFKEIYVFTESDGEWSQQQKLTPDDSNPDDDFAFAVSLSGDRTTAFVGAPDDNPNGSGSGSAYVFESNSPNSDQPSADVELRNVQITPSKVDGTHETHKLSFDVINLSTDGNKDEFSIKMPDDVDIDHVQSVEVDDIDLVGEPTASNPLEFAVDPEQTSQTTVTVKMKLSPSTNSFDARVGLLQPETGSLGNLGKPIQDAAALPAKQVADTEYQIDIRREDTETKPEVGVERAQEFADAGYPSVTGAASSGVTIAVAEDVLFPEEIVGISPSSTSPDITEMNGDYLLRTAPTDALQSQVAAQVGFNNEELESAATLYVNNGYGQGLSDAFVGTYEDLGGEVIATEAFEQEQSSYDSILNSVLADNPDMLYVIGYPASGKQIFEDFYENYSDDATTILVSDGLQDSSLPDDVNNPMSNVLGVAPSSTGPGRDTFDQLYKNEYNSEPGVFTAQAYDATAVHILAQLRADELTGPAVSEQIREIANPGGEVIQPNSLAEGLDMAANGDEIQYQGASGAIEFDENGDVSAATFDIFEFDINGYTVTDQVKL